MGHVVGQSIYSVMIDCTSASFVRWGKIKLISDGGDSVNKKFKRGCGDICGVVWWSLRLAGLKSLESGGLFCVAAFGSRREDAFTVNLLYKEFLVVYFKCDSQK
jgi:hypothetical protein